MMGHRTTPAEARTYAQTFARDIIENDDTTDDHMELAIAIDWYEAMLNKARRVCTAARRHVEWSRQFATGPGRAGVSETMRELEASVAELRGKENGDG